MKGVAAGFGDDVHERARHAPIFDIGVGTEKPELLHSFGVRRCAARVAPNIVVEAAIDETGIGGGAAAVHNKGVVVARRNSLRIDIGGSWKRNEEAVDVSSIEREIDNLFRVDQFTQFRGIRVYLHGISVN